MEVVSPALGRPAIVAPGGTLSVVLDEAPAASVDAALIQPKGGHRYALRASGDSENRAVLALQIEANTPDATYDLSIRSGENVSVVRHCVSVRKLGDRIRIVQLCPLRIGSPWTSALSAGLADEINAWAPDVVVTTSDYVDPLHPAAEKAWDEVRRFLTMLDAPTFAGCGPADDLMQFTRTLAPSASGELDLGKVRLLSVFESMLASPSERETQLTWLRRRLDETGPETGAVLVTANAGSAVHSAETKGTGVSLRAVLCTTFPTAPAEGARKGGPAILASDGVAGGGNFRYRVIDLGTQAALVGPGMAEQLVEAGSIEVQATKDGEPETGVRFVNRLAKRVDDMQARLVVPKSGSGRPWVVGGSLIRLIDCYDSWVCVVRTSVPAFGAVLVRAGSGEPPSIPRITASWSEPQAVEGLTQGSRVIVLRNDSNEPVTLQPIIRWAGKALWFQAGTQDVWGSDPLEGITLSAGTEMQLRLEAGFTPRCDRSGEVHVYPFGAATIVPLCLPPPESASGGKSAPRS